MERVDLNALVAGENPDASYGQVAPPSDNDFGSIEEVRLHSSVYGGLMQLQKVERDLPTSPRLRRTGTGALPVREILKRARRSRATI